MLFIIPISMVSGRDKCCPPTVSHPQPTARSLVPQMKTEDTNKYIKTHSY
jgi:hypothetical protein